MDIKEKAISNLEDLGINSKLENYTVYVIIGDNELQLSDFEIEHQAQEFDRKKAEERLEDIRIEIQNEQISYGEIQELQNLVQYIDKDDVELLQWAGVEN